MYAKLKSIKDIGNTQVTTLLVTRKPGKMPYITPAISKAIIRHAERVLVKNNMGELRGDTMEAEFNTHTSRTGIPQHTVKFIQHR